MQFFVIFFFAIVAVATAGEPAQQPEPGAGVQFEKLENPNDEEHSVEKRQVCVPGTTFRNYCNICTCHEDGIRSTCTQKRCGNGEFDKNTGQRPYVHYDLNMLGRRSGEPSRVGELVPSPEMRCEPEESFQFYCNTCLCGKDGVSRLCTLLYCEPGLWNRDGSLVEKLEEPELKWQNEELAAMRCEPHTSFGYYCNRCRCSASGTVAYCTKTRCSPGSYNRDGSRVVQVGRGDEDSGRTKRELEENSLDPPHKVLGFSEFLDRPFSCEPYQFFSRYCSFCQCAPDSQSVSCLHVGCPPFPENVDFVPFPLINRRRRSVGFAQICKPKSYVERSCNRCTCDDDGVGFECTIKQCSP